MRWLPALLALAFPVLAHVSAAAGSTHYAVAAVGCLLLLLCLPLRGRTLPFALALAASSGLLAALVASGRPGLLLLFPPVLLNAAFGSYFARSLAPGRTPLIERVVRALHPEAIDEPGVPGYARAVTRMWALLLLMLAAVNLMLALLAAPGGLMLAVGLTPPIAVSDAQWSLFANLLNYAIVALVFVAEYAWRRRRFPGQQHRSLPEFLRHMAQLGPAFWRGS